MHYIDWIIVIGFLALLSLAAIKTRKHTKSVADFLVAGRGAGRYLTCVAEGMASIAALSVIAEFVMYYTSGFPPRFWELIPALVATIVIITGWMVYRYRQTNVMTVGQLLEIRYSKKFRIFCGMLAWISGILNFGIFPSVATRFFICFCGLPNSIRLIFFDVPTYPLIMAILISIALFFCLVGGQIAVIVTDFLQGFLFHIVLVAVSIILLFTISWTQISEALLTTTDQPMINPFETGGKIKDFNIWFFLIGAFTIFYRQMTWQAQTTSFASAKSPQEAKMGRVLSIFRYQIYACFTIIAICVYTFLHHPDFAIQAGNIKNITNGIFNEHVRLQMTVPITLAHILPVGVLGALCVAMIAAFISTHDTYLMTWGTIFIQDVILPLRKKPLDKDQHIKWVRFSIFGVALFIFFFSLVWRHTDYLFMYTAITGTIFVGGAGSVMIGGLYWKRGTTAAAWVSMIAGSVLSVAALAIKQIFPDFPLNGQVMSFYAIVISIAFYLVISLLDKKPFFNMDKMLHRGKYAINEDNRQTNIDKTSAGKFYNLPFGDKIIYFLAILLMVVSLGVFVLGVVYNINHKIPVSSWLKFWHVYVLYVIIFSAITTIWLGIGGLIDLKSLQRFLQSRKRDHKDDGTVGKFY